MVQTVKREQQGDKQEKIERFSVLEGLRKYAPDHVLLVGRPGSGKSTAGGILEKTGQHPPLVGFRGLIFKGGQIAP